MIFFCMGPKPKTQLSGGSEEDLVWYLQTSLLGETSQSLKISSPGFSSRCLQVLSSQHCCCHLRFARLSFPNCKSLIMLLSFSVRTFKVRERKDLFQPKVLLLLLLLLPFKYKASVLKPGNCTIRDASNTVTSMSRNKLSFFFSF